MSWSERKDHELQGKHIIKHHGFLGVDLRDIEDGDMERILGRVRSPNVTWIRQYMCPYSSIPSCIPFEEFNIFGGGQEKLASLW